MESILDDNRSMTFRMTVTAMFAAVTAVASWISVPLPFTPVPINLATLAVTLAGAVLGWLHRRTGAYCGTDRRIYRRLSDFCVHYGYRIQDHM